MTTYKVDDSEFGAVRGKTILLTGCATGIGRATAKLAYENGATLILGDVLEEEGQRLASELGEPAAFWKCDVSNWSDVFSLFEEGWKRFGALDIVLANAGINEVGTFLDDALDPVSGLLAPPNLKTLSVNLLGMMYTTKYAIHYFSKQPKRPKQSFQLVMTGSAACFLDTPPLHVYGVSKAGVMGLMRSLCTQLPGSDKVTVNMVAPWLKKTPMLKDEFLVVWGELPANEPIGVARANLLPAVRPDLNGRSLFVAGHEIGDFEQGLASAQPLWMGKQLSDHVDEGQRRILPKPKSRNSLPS